MKKHYLQFSSLGAALLLSILSSTLHAQAQSAAPQLGKSPLAIVIAAMTVEEKAKLVVGMGFKMPGMPAPKPGEKKSIDIGGFLLPPSDPEAYSVAEKVPGAAGRTHAIERLGIPSMTVSDGPAGLRIESTRPNDKRTYFATAFPVATLLASTWDTSLVNQVGLAFGNEVHEYGVDILLAPALNIHRNPLGGRNFEYYSEDPLLAGSMTAAIVNGIEANGVGTSIKHFVANNQESSRNTVNTIVSERAMHELYLKGFEIAVKRSQPWTVMSSYNKLNGVYTSQRRDLLTNILKNEWAFKGFVMTDWFGGIDPVAQMNAGNDLIMPGSPSQSEAIVAAVKDRRISMVQLDNNVQRILTVVLRSPSFLKYKYSDQPDLRSHAQVSRVAAAEGMILLKNQDRALPLATGKRIALFGNTSYHIIAGGSGSGDVNKAYTISLIEGLKNAGYVTDDALTSAYASYYTEAKLHQPKAPSFFTLPPPIPEFVVEKVILDKQAEKADAAMITIGRNGGEGSDRKVENDFTLTQNEKDLISAVSKAFHAKGKKVVVVLNIGGVIEVASWRDEVDAILLAWQPGQEAGNAITDIISGKVNPSGRLATTFPMIYSDVPSAANFPGTPVSKPEQVVYEEGIYVGYRYYDTYKIKQAYEFGYGLGYTKFSMSDLKLSGTVFKGDTLQASIVVTNTGKTAGKQVVQLYVHAPALTLDKPDQELKGFVKTSMINPGESETVQFTIHLADLASFDTPLSSWIADKGEYQLRVGSSSLQIDQTASFKLADTRVIQKVEKTLVPQQVIKEFKGK